MLTIGTSSAVLRNKKLYEIIDFLALKGYDTVEIWIGQYFDSGLSPNELKDYLKRAGIGYRIHADMRDVNITSANRGIREESLRQIFRTIEIASEIKAPVVTVHPGKMSSSKDIPDEFWDIQLDVFSQIAEYSKRYEVVVGVENMENRPKEFIIDLPDIERLIKSINSSSLGLTLDLAHYYGVGNLLGFVEKLDVPIVNVHISQATPEKMHLPLSSDIPGIINYVPVLRSLKDKYNGPLIIEGYVRGSEIETVTSNYQWLKIRI